MAESAKLNVRPGTRSQRIEGIIPVMLTPFLDDGGVDYDGLDQLTDWYLARGADALFAVCQSSEMQFLTLEEKVAIARRVVGRVNRRVPVMASGHTATDADEQYEELSAIAESGVDALVLVTNRLDPQEQVTRVFGPRLDR